MSAFVMKVGLEVKYDRVFKPGAQREVIDEPLIPDCSRPNAKAVLCTRLEAYHPRTRRSRACNESARVSDIRPAKEIDADIPAGTSDVRVGGDHEYDERALSRRQ